MVASKAWLIWRNHGYIGVSSSRNRMVRGNGSARAETHVKATAKPKMMRITMQRGPHRDTLKNDLSTITISAFSFGSRCAAEWDARKLEIRLSGPFPDSQSWHA